MGSLFDVLEYLFIYSEFGYGLKGLGIFERFGVLLFGLYVVSGFFKSEIVFVVSLF